MLVVIGSSPDRSQWLEQCSSSLGVDHIAVVNYGFELAKFRWVVENTTVDRFLFLQDSWMVKDAKFWDLLAETNGSVSLNRDPYFFGCYAGVYESDIVAEIGVPVVSSKREAVTLEIAWNRKYVSLAGEPPVLFPELCDANATRKVELFGRENLVLENEYLVKFKGTWDWSGL